MIRFLFPWTYAYFYDGDEITLMFLLAAAADAIMWFLAIVFWWLWLPMLLIYLVAKSIEKLVGYIKKRGAAND